MEPIRLNKFISDTGTCSRRKADKMIAHGRVTVNGKTPEVGTKVTAKDKIRIDGQLLEVSQQEPVYLILNKPPGIETTTDLSQKDNIIRFVNYPERIFPVGRLDKDSEGLIFLTSDGDIVNKILRAGNKHEKEYIVTVNKAITPEFIYRMGSGVSILGVNTKKCLVTQESPFKFRIVLTQGMNRQIRRMCEALGYEVITLQRIRIMNFTLAKLPLGQWRYMTEEEIRTLQLMVADSTKTEEGSIGKKRAASNQENEPGAGRANKPRPRSQAGRSARPGATASKPGTKSHPGKKEASGGGARTAKGSRGASKGTSKNSPGKRSSSRTAVSGSFKKSSAPKSASKKRL